MLVILRQFLDPSKEVMIKLAGHDLAVVARSLALFDRFNESLGVSTVMFPALVLVGRPGFERRLFLSLGAENY